MMEEPYLHQEYPKKLYSKDGRMVRVLNADEHAMYPEWAESPAGPFNAEVRRGPGRPPRAMRTDEES